jgi:hypothetical protein
VRLKFFCCVIEELRASTYVRLRSVRESGIAIAVNAVSLPSIFWVQINLFPSIQLSASLFNVKKQSWKETMRKNKVTKCKKHKKTTNELGLGKEILRSAASVIAQKNRSSRADGKSRTPRGYANKLLNKAKRKFARFKHEPYQLFYKETER